MKNLEEAIEVLARQIAESIVSSISESEDDLDTRKSDAIESIMLAAAAKYESADLSEMSPANLNGLYQIIKDIPDDDDYDEECF